MEVLITRAVSHIICGVPIPLDLYAELMELGVDVEGLERKYNR